ncbi:50S ribosomal protein L6 [Rickettsiales bacterium]|nr:50S ribosomal protein L6 [Rickettsiales bacterium]
MSRIASKPIVIPETVNIEIKESVISASGAKGSLKCVLNNQYINYNYEAGKLFLKPANDSKKARSLCGLYRSNINNMIIGITQGYCKVLEINGVGYRANVNSKFGFLILSLGLSHEVILKIPDGISVTCQKETIAITGIDKQKVGMFAAKLFDLKRPEPYKASGISYQGMYILRKQGKRK